MTNQKINCKISEDKINCNIKEDKIVVRVSGGSSIDKAWEVLDNYLIIEDVTSQVDNTRIDFTVTYVMYNNFLNVFINGLKERGCVKIDNHIVRISPAPEIGDEVEIEYIKGE